MTRLQEAILKVVRIIPEGKVMSYGQVALYAGMPRGARLAGWLLRSMKPGLDLPWWRVINNKGMITIKNNKYANAETQKQLLEQDGVEVGDDFTVDMKKYRHSPKLEEISKLQLPEEYLEYLQAKGYV